jgi:hypothetical protein
MQRDNGTPVWSAISPENFTLIWMAAEDDIAYLHGVPSKYETDPERKTSARENCSQAMFVENVLRLDTGHRRTVPSGLTSGSKMWISLA